MKDALQGGVERGARLGVDPSGMEPTCQLGGPGRGDCEHFVGLPSVMDETTTDVYGRPNGWCWWCWMKRRMDVAEAAVRAVYAALRSLPSVAEEQTETTLDGEVGHE